MMLLEDIRAQLADRRIPIVAERAGLSTGTVYAVRDGRSPNPTYKVLKALSDYLTAPTGA